ncbi:hypothetical protein NC651_016684 [Populus alba x Populus x berolinensis]|nr:hypothetical protein NC651_016684 [Populus alba x Populus x berolinensis]
MEIRISHRSQEVKPIMKSAARRRTSSSNQADKRITAKEHAKGHPVKGNTRELIQLGVPIFGHIKQEAASNSTLQAI